MRSTVSISNSKDFWMTTAAEAFSFQMDHTPILNSVSVASVFFSLSRDRGRLRIYLCTFYTLSVCVKSNCESRTVTCVRKRTS